MALELKELILVKKFLLILWGLVQDYWDPCLGLLQLAMRKNKLQKTSVSTKDTNVQTLSVIMNGVKRTTLNQKAIAICVIFNRSKQ